MMPMPVQARYPAMGLLLMLLLMLSSIALLATPLWSVEQALPAGGLMLDLDADHGVTVEKGGVIAWANQIPGRTKDFVATRLTGRPGLRTDVPELHGHDVLVFHKQELIDPEEDVFDHLITGSGYTWCAVIAAARQEPQLQDVNSFFGDLRNGGLYEGFWGGFSDDGTLWIGSRNGRTFGRWNDDNPHVLGSRLAPGTFHVVLGRMAAGTGTVTIQLFIDRDEPCAALPFPVNANANSSKMAIGQERDAVEHPGKESFCGEIARMLIWDRPLDDADVGSVLTLLREKYRLDQTASANPSPAPGH